MNSGRAADTQPFFNERGSSMKQGNLKARGRLGPGAMYHMMMIPGILFLLVFSYVPMVGIITAFQDYIPAKGMFGSEFVGLKHFMYMFKLPDIAQVVSNTLVIAIGKILLGTMMAIIFSVLLNEIRIKYVKKSVQTIVYLPHFLSWVVLASVVVNMFSLDGIVNQMLAFLASKILISLAATPGSSH